MNLMEVEIRKPFNLFHIPFWNVKFLVETQKSTVG